MWRTAQLEKFNQGDTSLLSDATIAEGSDAATAISEGFQ